MRLLRYVCLFVATTVLALAQMGGSASGTTTSQYTFTITNGTSLSAGVNLNGCTPARVILPSAWTTANLTFQLSSDGGTTYNDLYDEYGAEISVVAAASRHVRLNPGDWFSLNHMKIRSGTSASAVNQGANRTIIVVCRVLR